MWNHYCSIKKASRSLKQQNNKDKINKAYEKVVTLYNVKNTARHYLKLYKTL